MPETIDFQRDVLDRSAREPVLVDFWAEWCGPCRTLGPVLERLATGGRFALVKVNTDLQPDIAATYRISSIPAVKLFRNGQVVGEFVGALPERDVVRFLDQYIPSRGKELLLEAKGELAAGRRDEARALLEQAVAAEPFLSEARIALAELRFRAEPEAALALVESISSNDPAYHRIESLRVLASLVARAAHGEPTPADVKPDLWARYLEGARAFAAGKDTEALDAWIEVLRQKRSLDEDGPRRACVALFQLLGDDSEVSREYRRAFTSALY
jgi:putative thioredoxin